MKRFLILGAGGFAEEVADLVSDISGYEVAGFVESLDRDRCRAGLRGLPVHWVEDIGPLAASCEAVCATGASSRAAFIHKVEAFGMRFATVVHPTARVSRTATIGDGAVISAGAVIAAQAAIGRHVIVNRGCLIGHHTCIGDGAVLGPGVNIGGATVVGSNVLIGIGAIVLDHRVLGDGAAVAAGAVVTKDIPAYGHVAGGRARQVRPARRNP